MRCNRCVSLCFTGMNFCTCEKQCSASSIGNDGTFSTSESSLRDDEEDPEDEEDDSSSTSCAECSSGGSACSVEAVGLSKEVA